MDNLVALSKQDEVNTSAISRLEINELDHQTDTTILIITIFFVIHIPFIFTLNAAVMVIIILVNLFHTPDNFIVFALALADFMHGFVVILILVEINDNALEALRGTRAACVFRLSFASLCYHCSMSFVMLTNMERGLAVMAPFRHATTVSERSVVVTIACVLLIELVFHVVFLSVFLDYDLSERNLFVRCEAISHTNYWYGSVFHFGKLSLQLIVSVGLSLQVYSIALRKQRNTTQVRDVLQSHGQQIQPALQYQQSEQQKAKQFMQVHLMVVFTCVFALLWLPELFLPLVRERQSLGFSEVYYAVAMHMMFLNSSLNPILYALRKPAFKKAYRFLIHNKPSLWKDVNMYMSQKESVFLQCEETNRLRLTKLFKRFIREDKSANLEPSRKRRQAISESKSVHTNSEMEVKVSSKKSSTLSTILSVPSFASSRGLVKNKPTASKIPIDNSEQPDLLKKKSGAQKLSKVNFSKTEEHEI